jgi:hypothetical protein
MASGFMGGDVMLSKILNIAREMPEKVGKAIAQEAEIEATEVKRRTPVDLGALRSSIHVEGPHYERSSIYASIVAGGVAAPYAIIVHEDLAAFHPVGQAKYLESVIMESRRWMAQRIAARIRVDR